MHRGAQRCTEEHRVTRRTKKKYIYMFIFQMFNGFHNNFYLCVTLCSSVHLCVENINHHL
jgi:hypothetical protein